MIDNGKRENFASNIFSGLTILVIIGLIIYNALSHGEVVSRIGYIDRNDTAMDFFNTVAASENVSLAEIFSEKINLVTYPAIATFLFKFFELGIPRDYVKHNITGYQLRENQYGLFPFLILWIFVMIFTFVLISKMKKGTEWQKYIFSFSCLCSYGFLCCIERGNLIMLCPCLVLFFLYGYNSSNRVIKELALFSLALAAGIKVYPAIFGVLLIVERKYKESFRTILYGMFCLFSLPLYFGGFKAVLTWIMNLVSYTEVQDPSRNLCGCSFRLIVKSFLVLFDINPTCYTRIQVVTQNVGYFICAIALILCFFQKTMWKKIAIITCVAIQSFSLSFDYCYAFVVFPMIFLCNEDPKLEKSESKICFILLCIILIPFLLPDLITFREQMSGFDFSRFVKQIAFLLLFLYCIIDSIKILICRLNHKFLCKKILAYIFSVIITFVCVVPILRAICYNNKMLHQYPLSGDVYDVLHEKNYSVYSTLYVLDNEKDEEMLKYFFNIRDDNFLSIDEIINDNKLDQLEGIDSVIISNSYYKDYVDKYGINHFFEQFNLIVDGRGTLETPEKDFIWYRK